MKKLIAAAGGVGLVLAVWSAGALSQEETDDAKRLLVHLGDGSIVTGRFATDVVKVNTLFGSLAVPVDNIVSFSPGLDSRPDYAAHIYGLVEGLGAEDAVARDAAETTLAALGPPVLHLLESYLDDTDPERKLRVEQVIGAVRESADDDGPACGGASDVIRKGDTIVTTEFTIVGEIMNKQFTINNRYGQLQVNLSDIERVRLKGPAKAAPVRMRLSVTGGHVVPRNWLRTDLRLKSGQVVKIKASGEIHLTPWGDRGHSGPDGTAAAGWHVINEIPNGALMGRVGANGPAFKVGQHLTFTADRSGVLQLGVGVHPSHSGKDYPGEYVVKIRVEPAE